MRRMRSIVLFTCAGLAALALAKRSVAGEAAPAGSANVQTVDSVDLARYAGLWFEIARIPNRFQKDCASGTTAHYALRDDGRIDVTNRCLQADGSPKVAKGVARIVPGSGNARLEVSFVSFLGWRPFWGDYWILGLGAEYEWVAIGTPDRTYGWILSRSPTADAHVLETAFTILEKNGYDRESFRVSGSP